MIIQPTGHDVEQIYEDFKRLVAALGKGATVFAFDQQPEEGVKPEQFAAYAIDQEADSCVVLGPFTTKPASFTQDFPKAVAIQGLLTVSG